MKITLINGSPKPKESTSGLMMEYLGRFLGDSETCTYTLGANGGKLREKGFEDVLDSDAVVFAFPLYIDSIPSHLLRLLTKLETKFRESEKKPMIYCIIVNGFFEGIHNCLAVDNMKYWCKRSGLTFGQAIGCGAGEMMPLIKNIPLGYGPNKNIGESLQDFAANILQGTGGEDSFVNPNWPRFLWKIQSSLYVWHPSAKQNGMTKKDVLRRLS